MTQHPLNLLMVSSEAVPYAKTGGLADVAGVLPLELAKLGHDVILLLPRYRCLNESGRSFRSVCRLHVPTPQGLVETLIEEDVIPVGAGDCRARCGRFGTRPSSIVRGCTKITVSTIPIILTGFHSSAARRLR